MKAIRNLILDMDGVVWRGMTPMPGLTDFFATLRRLNIGVVLATNNASRTVEQYVAKLAGFGVTVEPWQILTSAETTADHVAQHYPPATRIFVVGSDGLHHGLRARGFDVINPPNRQLSSMRVADLMPYLGAADLVVVGFTPLVNYADFAQATYYINNGARFIGSNPDVTFPSEIGPLPGAGALLALIETATGVTPEIIGKPARAIFEQALRRLGATADQTAMVGDRIATDIVGGRNAGLHTVLLLSGVTAPADLAASDVQPDYVFDDITALAAALQRAHVGEPAV